MDLKELVEVDTRETDKEVAEALSWAKALVIMTQEEYVKADAICRGWFGLRKKIEADFKPTIDKAKEGVKAARATQQAAEDQRDSHTQPLFAAEQEAKPKLFAWRENEEKKRQALEAENREKARKLAEDEKVAKAAKFEAQGNMEKAEAVLSAPLKVAPVVVPPSVPKAETKIAQYWSYEITDSSEVKREFCAPDRGTIQTQMNAYKKQGKSIEETEALIGGVKIEARIK